MYIERKLQEKVEKYIDSPEIIAVVGPRQSGKTTLLERIHSRFGDKAVFLSFEDPETISMFETATADFINLYVKNKKALFIDEFQYSPSGGKILKQIYDSHKIKIFISGSSSIDLTVKALKYLVGRVFTFELLPFDFEEFLRAKNIELTRFYIEHVKAGGIEDLSRAHLDFGEDVAAKLAGYFEEYTLYGGYPRVVTAADVKEKEEVLRGLYSTLFLREVKDYLGLTEDYRLHKLIKAFALRVGNLIEYNELGKLSECNFVLLKKYLNFLDKAYICSMIRPFFTNKNKELVKNPKAYMIDNGLRNFIVGDFRDLHSRPDAGALLENAVYSGFRKQGLDIKYWRDKKKNEVDFIIEKNGRLTAIEIKLSLDGCAKNSGMAAFLQEHPGNAALFAYLHGFNENTGNNKGNTCLPAYVL